MTIMDTAPAEVTTDPESEAEGPKEAHIIRKGDHAKGYIFGQPVTALCGKIWVPSRDPEKLPLCPRCQELMEQIKQARGGNN